MRQKIVFLNKELQGQKKICTFSIHENNSELLSFIHNYISVSNFFTLEE